MSNSSKAPNEALDLLKKGNQRYIDSKCEIGDISVQQRTNTFENGQHPYAVIITCSDSRVIPEAIFSAGIGDLFVIRVAGNVMDNHQLGSVEYAAEHLGCPLAVVLGHTHCGAVDAALNHKPEGHIKSITDEISKAVGDEKDAYKASVLNAKNSSRIIKESLKTENGENGLTVVTAIYDIESGKVEFFED